MTDDKFLKGLDDIPRDRSGRCVNCGRPLTPSNDSGWHRLNERGEWAPMCVGCDEEWRKEPPLKEGAPTDD